MKDPYLIPHTDVLKNLAQIKNKDKLSEAELEFTSIRLAEISTRELNRRLEE